MRRDDLRQFKSTVGRLGCRFKQTAALPDAIARFLHKTYFSCSNLFCTKVGGVFSVVLVVLERILSMCNVM